MARKKPYGKFTVHPAADAIPLDTPEQCAELAASIKQKGLKHPITLTANGKQIIDGRNRYLACTDAGVKPKFKRFRKSATEADIINYVETENLDRRDLTPGQRAIAFRDLEKLRGEPLKAEAQERKRESNRIKPRRGNGRFKVRGSAPRKRKREGTASDAMAKKAKTSGGTMRRAMAIEDYPDLVDQVRRNERSLEDAYKEARARKKTSAAPEEKPALSKHMVTLVTHEGKPVPYKLPKGLAKFNATNECVGWARWTWNPVTGCLHDCPWGCYAREMAHRETYAPYYPVKFTPLFHHERLDAPKNMDVPSEAKKDPSWRRVFVCSMADLFGGWVPDDWIKKVLAVCHANPQWEYLFLTKNPRRYLEFQLPPTAWVGTSIDYQKRVRLAEEVFRQIKNVRVKWFSGEPLMEELKFKDLSIFNWFVLGALTATVQPEGRKSAFAPKIEWVTRLTEEGHAAGCKVFQKANLLGDTHPQSPGMQLIQEVPTLPDLPKAQGQLALDAAE
jgi:protein gp37/ParB-like chromosome segregation protein Spo0J